MNRRMTTRNIMTGTAALGLYLALIRWLGPAWNVKTMEYSVTPLSFITVPLGTTVLLALMVFLIVHVLNIGWLKEAPNFTDAVLIAWLAFILVVLSLILGWFISK